MICCYFPRVEENSQYLQHSWYQDSAAPVETPQEEMKEPVSDSDSDHFPEDDIPEEEEEDDDEEDEDDELYDKEDKVGPQSSSITPILDDSGVYSSESLSVFLQAEPSYDADPGEEG